MGKKTKVSLVKDASADKRYHVYGLMGDVVRDLVAGATDDEAKAVTQATLFDGVGIYGRVLVRDEDTGEIIVCFENGKPIDPSTLEPASS